MRYIARQGKGGGFFVYWQGQKKSKSGESKQILKTRPAGNRENPFVLEQ